MPKNKNLVLKLFLVTLSLLILISISDALAPMDSCAGLFPNDTCHNGGCDGGSSAGNCEISNCWCSKYCYYFDHDCNSGNNTPPCD
jgi:hypothetical protein